MPFNLSKKSWLGVAREATAGTAMTGPTLYVPQKSVMKGTKKRVYITDERNTRDGNNDVVDTTHEGAVDPKGNWYNDSSVYFLAAGLGGISSAQPNAGTAPTVYKHTITCADNPFALTTFKGYGGQVYYMPYSVVEKWTLKWSTDGKLLEFDSDLKGNFPVPYTGSTLTPAYSSVKAFAGYVPTITLGGSSTTDIDEVSIEFAQKWTFWFPSGSQDFVTAYPGERTVKVDFTARFDSTTIFDRFRNGSDDTFSFDVLGAVIASTYHQELNVAMPLIGYDDVTHDLSKDNVLIKAKATARPSADTTTPPINAYVQNTITSYTA